MPLWDNARWIAITLVVIGHGILPLISEDDVAYSVYLFIYSFHVAVFVTVSGYFAKSGPPNARALRQILTDIVFPFFIFETIWTVIRWVLGGAFELDYTTASWTLWFLIALAVWRIVLPYLVLLRFPLLIAIAISIGAGYTESIDATLALSRTFGMLPFFVFGWKLRQWQLTGRWLDLPSRVAWRWRAGAIALFAAVLLVMPIAIETWRDLRLRRFMLYDESYQAIGYDEPWSGAIRLALLLFAMLLSVAFLVLMPRRTTWFTPFGTATMYIYLLHTFVLFPFRETGDPRGRPAVLGAAGDDPVLHRHLGRAVAEARAAGVPAPRRAAREVAVPAGAVDGDRHARAAAGRDAAAASPPPSDAADGDPPAPPEEPKPGT